MVRDDRNKYDGYDDRYLIREYDYLRPMGDPAEPETQEKLQEMSTHDLMHLLMVMDAMARRIDPRIRPE